MILFVVTVACITRMGGMEYEGWKYKTNSNTVVNLLQYVVYKQTYQPEKNWQFLKKH